jgi:hypothetical protein
MRPSFPELMHGLFWFAMALTILGVGIKSCTVLDGIEKRQQQGNLHHEKIMALADKSLRDHDAFLAQHDAIMQRLVRP